MKFQRPSFKSWGALTFFAWALGAYAIGAFLFSYYARTYYDEELFLYAANLVYDGKLPYRDFLFTFGPVLPFVYGLPQALFGPSLLVGRMTAAALSVVTAAAGSTLAYRFSGRMGVLVFLALMALSPRMLQTFTLPRTESLVAPLLMLALAVWISRPRDRPALVLAASLLLWATAVRHTAAFAFIGLTALILYQFRDRARDVVLAVAALGLQAFALFGVPALLAWDGMWFGTVQAHWEFRQGNYSLNERLEDVVTYPFELFGDFFAVLMLAAIAVFLLIWRWRQGWRMDLGALDTDVWSAQALLLLAALLVAAPHVSLRLIYTHYFAVSAAILAVLVGISVRQWRMLPWPWVATVALLVAVLVAQGITFSVRERSFLDTERPAVGEFRAIGEYVHRAVGPDGQVVTFHPGYALVDGLPLPPELAMGVLSYTSSTNTERVEELKVVNRERLDELLLDPRTRLFIMDDWTVRFWVLGSTAKDIPEEARPVDELDAVEQFYFLNFPALMQGGYRLDREFEQQFSERFRFTHAFIR